VFIENRISTLQVQVKLSVYFATRVDTITLAATVVPSERLVAPYGRFRVFLILCYLKACDRTSSTGAHFVNRTLPRAKDLSIAGKNRPGAKFIQTSHHL
jgi:hypothetical protein